MKNVISKFNSLSTKAKTVGLTTACTLMSSCPVFAAGEDAGLDSTVQTAISNGFTSAGKSIAVIVGLGVTATVGVIAVSGGAKAGLKWVKGVFSKAS